MASSRAERRFVFDGTPANASTSVCVQPSMVPHGLAVARQGRVGALGDRRGASKREGGGWDGWWSANIFLAGEDAGGDESRTIRHGRLYM